MSSVEIPSDLPPVYQSIIDEDTLRHWGSDLRAFAQVREVVTKSAATQFCQKASLSLDEALEFLIAQEVQAIQVRYCWSSHEWLDTVLVSSGQFRICRLQVPDTV